MSSLSKMECVLNKLLGVIDCVLFKPKKISLIPKSLVKNTNKKRKSVEKNTIYKIRKLIEIQFLIYVQFLIGLFKMEYKIK